MNRPATATTPHEQVVRELLADARVQRAFRMFEEDTERVDEEHVSLCETPAPPFKEGARARLLAEMLRACGLGQVSIDEEGNCVAFRAGREERPLVVLSAHLDTVFPEGTDCTVRRDGHLMRAPGAADDGCGLAALVAVARAVQVCGVETRGPILFVGTVGEEGEGNLRGVRALLTKGEWAGRVDYFLSMDGPGVERITNVALGSRRYRVRFSGAGGHSWGDFGAANPVHAAARAVARLASYPAPARPRTTFNVGRIEGGTSVNAIPQEASMDVDLRSESPEELKRIDAFFRRAAREAADEENAARRREAPAVSVDVKLIGDRPSGETPRDSFLVALAREATRAVGFEPRLECSSTDSNVPVSLGIPAVTFGAGGASGNSHTLDEWYDPRGRDLGLKRALLVTLGAAGLASSDEILPNV